MVTAATPGNTMTTVPEHKVTPASGLYLVNPERRGVLVLDQQNVAGQFDSYGFRKVDPRWYLNMANRITNLERAVAVADLQAFNPTTNQSYLATAWIWDKFGFDITHVPARRILRSTNFEDVNGDQAMTETEEESLYERKDMTDSGVRDSIQTWCNFPNVSHILLASHDSDFFKDAKKSIWAKDKRVTLLSVGNERIATALRGVVHEVVSVLGYAPAYSAHALNKRDWWREAEDLGTRRKKIKQWFDGKGPYPRYLENQLRDMQALFKHIIHDLELLPAGSTSEPQRLSMGLLKLALHKFMSWEKTVAKLKSPVKQPIGVPTHSIEMQDLFMVPAQARACNDSLESLLRILIDGNVLLHEPDPNRAATKLYYLNTEHPAVKATLEISFT